MSVGNSESEMLSELEMECSVSSLNQAMEQMSIANFKNNIEKLHKLRDELEKKISLRNFIENQWKQINFAEYLMTKEGRKVMLQKINDVSAVCDEIEGIKGIAKDLIQDLKNENFNSKSVEEIVANCEETFLSIDLPDCTTGKH